MNRKCSGLAALRQSGFTLVEILVALTVGLVVAAAAVAALLIGRQGFTSTDSSAQLRENARFAASLIQRITVQAGSENLGDADAPPPGYPIANKDPSYLQGFDDSVVGTAGNVVATLTHGSRSSGCGFSDTSCNNGSDVLVIRYKGAPDGSMIDCSGQAAPAGVPGYHSVSIFNVKRSQSGEPTLMCTFQNAGSTTWTDVPLVQGVEAFQVLYGTDDVNPGTTPSNPDTSDITINPNTDNVPDRYLSAKQLDVAGVYNRDNWARVRSLRIGLLLRGPVGSAVDRVSTIPPYQVLGPNFSQNADTKSQLSISPPDGRLRQSLIFTVHLRNPQSVPP